MLVCLSERNDRFGIHPASVGPSGRGLGTAVSMIRESLLTGAVEPVAAGATDAGAVTFVFVVGWDVADGGVQPRCSPPADGARSSRRVGDPEALRRAVEGDEARKGDSRSSP